MACALIVLGQAGGNEAATHVVGPVLQAVACVLLLICVYAGRPSPSVEPSESPESVWQSVSKVSHARPGLLAVFLVCFMGVFLLVVTTTTLVTFILPESYFSKARVMLRPGPTSAAPAPGVPGGSGAFDPRYLQTQREVIGSDTILRQAIGDLDLNKAWGIRYAAGESLHTPETMALLRARMDLRPVRNTSIIEIGIYSEKSDESAKIANAIAVAYRDHSNGSGAAASVSDTPHVEILYRAVAPFRPMRPNKPLNITLGVVMGLVLGLVVGGCACWASFAMGRKGPPKLAPG
jgi:uncharacterized protein involved in exopolysaccharide biosynthesis